ncbi:MAG: DUF1926 domain-containing protein, partial [Spirochaetaceae bacterium]|nr:DUF1926 domain-containing protein [Spirochaetaceae bacterium]
ALSEDQGKIITIFPILSRLYPEFSQKRASLVLEELQREVPPGGLVSIFPERFFPDKGSPDLRIHQFFEDLSKAEGFVEFTSPSRFLKNLRGLQKAFFPSSAGERIRYWAMDTPSPAASAQEFPSGSLPRRFLVKYPEANGIYSKMIFVNTLINQLRGDKSRKRTAREELLKAQGFDVFCHLGDGGIYCNALRKAVYRAFLSAEKITREKGVFIPSLMVFDFDLDGENEFLFQDYHINCYIKTQGASVFELDYLPKGWNYLDTLARRREPYVEEPIPEDRYRRGAFLDRLTPPDFSLADAREGRFTGSRFCGIERYELASMDRAHGQARFLLAPREGLPFGQMEVEKVYRLKKDALTVHYGITNRGKAAERFKLVPEIDLSFPGEGAAFQRVFALRNGAKERLPAETVEYRDAGGLEFLDIRNEVIISLLSTGDFTLWISPVRTRCRIGGVLTDQYQSTCVMPLREVSLLPGETWETEFTVKFSH